MSSASFLSIDEELVSFEQIVQYLQVAGKFQLFLDEILNQHILAQELHAHPEFAPTPQVMDQLLTEFCQQNHLGDRDALQQWLNDNNVDDAIFVRQLSQNWTLQQLKQQISQPRLHEHFIKHKLSLDRVVLSYIEVNDAGLIQELRDQIEEGTTFEQLAKEHSLAENKQNGGRMAPISRGDLQDDLRAAIDAAQVGDLIGPLSLNQHWYLFRLEEVRTASLEGALKEELEAELFEEWLAKKVANMNVKLKVEQWLPIKTTFGR